MRWGFCRDFDGNFDNYDGEISSSSDKDKDGGILTPETDLRILKVRKRFFRIIFHPVFFFRPSPPPPSLRRAPFLTPPHAPACS